jgi:hypothetical protein
MQSEVRSELASEHDAPVHDATAQHATAIVVREQSLSTRIGTDAQQSPASDEALASGLPDITVPEQFSVRDEKSANWVVRKIHEARAYAEQVEAWAAAEVERARREEEFFVLRYSAELEQFAAAELLKQKGKRKSVSLPAGMLGFRAEPEKLRVQDEIALLHWSRLRIPEAVRVDLVVDGTVEVELRKWLARYAPPASPQDETLRIRVSRRAVNDHFQNTGEWPDGCVLEPAREKFYIK